MLYHGVILAGGSGTRLYPATIVSNKHLLPIYNKPVIYYSLSILLLMNITNILLITNKKDIDDFKFLLGDGSKFGIKITYATQSKPSGISHALIENKYYLKNKKIILMLGDNFFMGNGLTAFLENFKNQKKPANVICCKVNDPERFGVLNIKSNKLKGIAEKPKKFISDLAVTGLYIFNKNLFNYLDKIKPSKRGEYEITDILNLYIKDNSLSYKILNRGFQWYDIGENKSFIELSNIIDLYENKLGFVIGSLEEIAYRKGFIDTKLFNRLISKMPESSYKKNLIKVK